MQTTSQQALSPEKHSDSESANKFKTLFKKEENSDNDKSVDRSTEEREMFDLTALHKRNERHK